MKFVDRQRELQSLDDLRNTSTAGLFILYGRRRVGKTRLLSHWLESRHIENALYWTATTHGAPYQLRDFSQQLLRFDPRFQTSPALDFSFPHWEAVLEHLAGLIETTTAPLMVIVDEFTYLTRHEPALARIPTPMSRCCGPSPVAFTSGPRLPKWPAYQKAARDIIFRPCRRWTSSSDATKILV